MALETQITGQDIQDMVSHFLNTPVNGYLGSGYGQDLPSILQTPQSAGLGDEFVSKMREDVPILGLLPAGAVNVYAADQGYDKLNIVVEVLGKGLVVR